MPTPAPGDLLFAYGTLKMGGQYHHLLNDGIRPCNALLGIGSTVQQYPLIIAQYPCLLDQPGIGFRVRGEVYRISDQDTWKQLDWLEDHPGEYIRRLEPVEVNDQTVQAWTYYYQLPDRLPDSSSPVEEFSIQNPNPA